MTYFVFTEREGLIGHADLLPSWNIASASALLSPEPELLDMEKYTNN